MPTTSIASADLDGRAQSPRFIQRQLRQLHTALVENAEALKAAPVADNYATPDEACMEFFLALEAVRRRYLGVNIRTMLDDEYRISSGRDWEGRKVPSGIVVIRPHSSSLLYSTVTALSSAIAAGNCVMIEMQNSLLEASQMMKKVLQSALDQDIFAVVEKVPSDAAFTRRCFIVDQHQDQMPLPPTRALQMPPDKARVVAVVDRSADIAAAARFLVTSRVARNGSSTYAPDIVLVNEFAMDDFTSAAVEQFTKRLQELHWVAEPSLTKVRHRRNGRQHVLGEDERTDPDSTIVLEGDNGKLAKIGNRKLAVLSKKISGPNLLVHPISSLDDAIDFANSSETTLLAAYHFGALPAAKYTAQFINAHVSFVNHIPIELQVGPAAPLGWPVSAADRYRPEMFSQPAPQFLAATEVTKRLSMTFGARHSRTNWSSILTDLQSIPLPTDDRRDGKVVGFFDQGLLTGASLLLTPVVGGLVIASWYGVRAGLRWRRA